MRELKNHLEQSSNQTFSHTITTGNKSKKRLVRRLSLFFAFAFVVVVSVSFSLHKQSVAVEAQKKEIRSLSTKLKTLQTEEKKLHNEIKKLNDDDYIANIARRDYFFSKPGEVIIPISK
ncbi:septum formation initiator family protein [Ectobacillus sp. JY-23]|uniref:FtsB family cell division protein n=1 Tax=Ectobacillus sp. JY-23 TaxID=2933872 RepID=UPI001FF56F58|nr:septum formation initiator family protein [Ectobacillus sp. JY-23]UOY91429.1 septum formation initiator family protein [Ectobacillus sp. JY-23]